VGGTECKLNKERSAIGAGGSREKCLHKKISRGLVLQNEAGDQKKELKKGEKGLRIRRSIQFIA